jgi:hypothetical protein
MLAHDDDALKLQADANLIDILPDPTGACGFELVDPEDDTPAP